MIIHLMKKPYYEAKSTFKIKIETNSAKYYGVI